MVNNIYYNLQFLCICSYLSFLDDHFKEDTHTDNMLTDNVCDTLLLIENGGFSEKNINGES